MHPLIFPTTLTILQGLASIVYATKGNLKMTLYWAFAVGLTIVVTYLK